ILPFKAGISYASSKNLKLHPPINIFQACLFIGYSRAQLANCLILGKSVDDLDQFASAGLDDDIPV
ncbi:MAG: hypothetical protein AAFO91_20390, partial [Bacteroidota bacterium]